MFLLEGGELLLNEVAPRPHNSGHYTIEATSISQFEQHLRAILGWPLADVLPLAGARWGITWTAFQHASCWPDLACWKPAGEVSCPHCLHSWCILERGSDQSGCRHVNKMM